VRDEEGGVREMVLVIEHVSERHRAGEEVRRAEARFRAIIEGAAVGIALTDLSVGRLVETNPALRRILGYAEEELRGMSFADFTHPEDVSAKVREPSHRLGMGAAREREVLRRLL
jgi:PAS domain S-box-containing protein